VSAFPGQFRLPSCGARGRLDDVASEDPRRLLTWIYKTGALTVGYDGTVVQALGNTFFNDGTANHNCNFRWWTGFLQ